MEYSPWGIMGELEFFLIANNFTENYFHTISKSDILESVTTRNVHSRDFDISMVLANDISLRTTQAQGSAASSTLMCFNSNFFKLICNN